MAQKQICLDSDMGRLIPKIRSTTTSKLSNSTDSRSEFALEKETGWKLHRKTVLAEQATKKLRSLRMSGVGTHHLEYRDIKLRGKLRSGVDMGRGINRIKEALSDKIKDSERNSSKLRSNRDSRRRDMENSEVFEKGKVNKMIKDIKMRSLSLREKTIVKNVKSVNHLIKKWKVESKDDSERSRPEIEGF